MIAHSKSNPDLPGTIFVGVKVNVGNAKRKVAVGVSLGAGVFVGVKVIVGVMLGVIKNAVWVKAACAVCAMFVLIIRRSMVGGAVGTARGTQASNNASPKSIASMR